MDLAVGAARRALPAWSALPAHARARHLYALARHVQKHARLVAVVEAMDNGKTVRETRDADVPVVVSSNSWRKLKTVQDRFFSFS